MTRRQVRSQPIQNDAEQELQKLLAAYDARMRRLNDQYLRMMGEHIRDIGTMWPSDVHRLQQIRRMNKNLQQIERRIAAAAKKEEREIAGVFQRIAQDDARMAAKILGVPDLVNVKDNLPLQRILQAQARETAGRMRNLSNTTVVSGFYRSAVDEAVSAVQSGVEDYNTAIRRVIREAGQHGLRVRENGTRAADYESGHSRRLDSAVRMNVLDGVRHLNQSIMEEVGRQFGANGVEIDAHMLCAEDHLPYQGQQFSNEDFEQIQDGLQRPFGEWNCRHSWHGIILGVSPPTYTPEELERYRRYSTEEIEVDGRTKTRYQWSQEMRRIETAVRQQKDTATLAAATGDGALQRRCQGQILELNRYYEQLADRVGIGPEFQRTYVAGFRDAVIKQQDHFEPKTIQIGEIYSKISGMLSKGSTESKASGEENYSISDANSFVGLTHYLKSQYNIAMDPAVRKLRFDNVKRLISGTDAVLKHFPAAARQIQKIAVVPNGTGSPTVIATTIPGRISLSNVYFARGRDSATSLESYITKNAGKQYVSNASVESIGAHEAGHLIEAALIGKNPVYQSSFSRQKAWNEGTEAARIVDAACTNVRQTDYGATRNYGSMRSAISGYSMKSKSETLAEAVADWYTNGEKAKPLSKEIIRLLERELFEGE